MIDRIEVCHAAGGSCQSRAPHAEVKFWIPQPQDNRPAGSWQSARSECCLSMVPRDGVEPPTPAFSGLDSSGVILLISLALSVFLAIEITRFFEHNGTGLGTGQLTMREPTSPVSLSTACRCDSGTNC